MKTPVALSLSHDQALVLFDWLGREEGKNRILTEHPAEQQVLWEIEGQLERALVEPLQPDYAAAIAAARARIMSREQA